MTSASGFFQWRTSGGKEVKTNLPLLDFPYSKLPAADKSATACRQWRIRSKPVVCNRGKSERTAAGYGLAICTMVSSM